MNTIQVRNAHADKTATVLIYDFIGAGWFEDGVLAKNLLAELEALGDIDTINVRINSPGGSVFEGFAIFNALRNHGARLEVDIDSVAASMASVIALAGDVVRMADNAVLMIHDISSGAWGSADDLRTVADLVDGLSEKVRNVYAKKTGMSHDELQTLMAAETWMDAAEAKQLGFVDEVTPSLALAACYNADACKFSNAPGSVVALHAQAPPAEPPSKDPKMTDPTTTAPGANADAQPTPEPSATTTPPPAGPPRTDLDPGNQQPETDELQARAAAAARYTEVFAARGAGYFAAGLSFESAQTEEMKHLQAENKRLADIVDAGDAGEGEPADFSQPAPAGEQGKTDEKRARLARQIGPGAAALSTFISISRNN